ncbi:GroES-like protein [Dentipellis sp. KUC8613]|nr:GroES-like protein [Dentipellis sp. KUC8613]
MATQKALLLHSKGAPFTLGTRLIPSPGADEVLVKLSAVAINPVDYYMQLVGFGLEEFPAVAGNDGAGTVEAIGEASGGVLKKGDRVLFQCIDFKPNNCTFQQYALIKAKRVYRLPDFLSFEEAVTIPLGFGTATMGLYAPRTEHGGAGLTAPWEEGGLGKYTGQPALVIAGSSSVGQFAIQLLKLSGFDPIISTASAHNEAYVRAAGATHFIDYKTTPYAKLPEAIAGITSAPIGVVYDAIGLDETQRAGWAVTGPGGSFMSVRAPVVGKPRVEQAGGRYIFDIWGGVTFLDKEDATRPWGDKMYAGVSALLAEGALKPNKWELVKSGLAGVPDAAEKVGKLQMSGGKAVARIDDTP